MKQTHSHPVLRRQVPEKRTESKADIVPVEEFPVQVPSFAKEEHAAERRSQAVIQYADYAILNDMQTKCNLITDEFKHKAILYIGSEEYDYATITILQGLSSLGFEVYTLRKPNINSWFRNEVLDSTSGLKVDFVLSNVGWGTRWSYYRRYQLKRFPRVLINSFAMHWENETVYRNDELNKAVPDDADSLEIQPHRWAEHPGSYVPDVVFSEYTKNDAVYLPPGIHHEYLEVGVKAIHPNAGPRSLDPVYLLAASHGQGESVIPSDIASLISQDSGIDGVHGWYKWITYRGTADTFNRSAVACCAMAGTNQRILWQALACGCLVMFYRPKSDAGDGLDTYPVTCISPFTVFQSQGELQDKLDWLTEHPDLLNRLRQDSERLALKYFTPVPLAKRFLWYVHEAIK